MFAAFVDQLLVSQTRFFGASIEAAMAGNKLVGIFWLNYLRSWAVQIERHLRMDEVERDSDVTINVGFGNITFYRDAQGAYAHTIVDLSEVDEQRRNAVQVDMRFSCSPDTESIKDVVEKSRLHLLNLLRSALSHVEAQTAEGLLYKEEISDD